MSGDRSLIGRNLWTAVSERSKRIIEICASWLFDKPRITYGFAVARILLGASAIGVLVSNFSTRYVVFGSASEWFTSAYLEVNAFMKVPLFGVFRSIVYNDGLFTLMYIFVFLLAVCYTIGWRTRFIAPVFWVLYVSLLHMNHYVTGQVGDILWRIAVPALFFTQCHAWFSIDAIRMRRWRIDDSDTGYLGQSEGRKKRSNASFFMKIWRSQPVIPAWVRNMMHNAMLVFLIGQLSIQYVTAALYKTGETWRSGVATYYAFQLEDYQVFPEWSDFLSASALVVGIATYVTILSQVLFPGLLLSKPTRMALVVVILGFHLMIGIFMGLLWFSLTMIAVDMILVTDRTWDAVQEWYGRYFKRSVPSERMLV